MDVFSVLAPGGYTTIQDEGRCGYQRMGIPVCGALDAFAFRAANLLLSNFANAAVMEITVMGPRLEIMAEADLVVTGAEMGMTLNDQPLDVWKSFRVKPGDILDIQQVKSGCRAYLAVNGGIDVPEVMGSRSTYVGGNIGGYHGRLLKAGDIIKCGRAKRLKGIRAMPSDMIPAWTFYSNRILWSAPKPTVWATGSRDRKSEFATLCPKALYRSPLCREGFKSRPTSNPSYSWLSKQWGDIPRL
jgi:biotin-dependent carboxylase-like uncharacterized protein